MTSTETPTAVVQRMFAGHAAVRRFFARILERLEMTEFNTDGFVAEGDTVVIFGREAGSVRATGQAFRNVWSQRSVVRGGLIAEMAEYDVQVEPRVRRRPTSTIDVIAARPTSGLLRRLRRARRPDRLRHTQNALRAIWPAGRSAHRSGSSIARAPTASSPSTP